MSGKKIIVGILVFISVIILGCTGSNTTENTAKDVANMMPENTTGFAYMNTKKVREDEDLKEIREEMLGGVERSSKGFEQLGINTSDINYIVQGSIQKLCYLEVGRKCLVWLSSLTFSY